MSLARAILSDIADEQVRQLDKWGVQHHQDTPIGSDGLSVFELLHIPAVEMAKATTDDLHRTAQETWADILLEEFCEAVEAAQEESAEHLREELVQVAAVAASWIRDIDTRETP